MRVKVTINRAGINAACRLEGVYHDLERRADRVISAAGFAVIERSGAYRRGLQRDRFRARAGRAGVRVTATAAHSAVLEFGSRPHVIEPRNKRALFWRGAAHPVQRVQHPGTAARHVLRSALRAARL